MLHFKLIHKNIAEKNDKASQCNSIKVNTSHMMQVIISRLTVTNTTPPPSPHPPSHQFLLHQSEQLYNPSDQIHIHNGWNPTSSGLLMHILAKVDTVKIQSTGVINNSCTANELQADGIDDESYSLDLAKSVGVSSIPIPCKAILDPCCSPAHH